MKCKHCEEIIPQKRVDLGYRECVNCSTTQRWSANPVIFHKTGNTTEIIKDPEVAADIAFASARKGFGVLRGMTGRRKPVEAKNKTVKKSQPIQQNLSRPIGSYKPTYYFEEVGAEAMSLLETLGAAAACEHIEKSLEEKRIFKKQALQLNQIIEQLGINHGIRKEKISSDAIAGTALA